MILITTIYEQRDHHRLGELIGSIETNLENNYFNKIILFCENISQNFKDSYTIFKNPKIVMENIETRPTYKTFFDYANNNLKNEICVISNTDIYFDESLGLVNSFNFDGNVFMALTRYDKWPEDIYRIRNFEGSYDSYIFRSPLPDFSNNIVIGINGCDSLLLGNALNAGFRVINPCNNVKSYHRHFVGGDKVNSLPDGSVYWNCPGYNSHAYVNVPMISI